MIAQKEIRSLNQQLLAFEEVLPAISFTTEKSPLVIINGNFPSIDGGNFIQHLDNLSVNGGSVLEIGGGIYQEAAIEILQKFPGLSFSALEKRPIDSKAKDKLKEFQNYRHEEKGLSEISNVFEGEEFDIIFAHFVMEHIPDRLSQVVNVLTRLKQGGILFCNRVFLYREDMKGFVNLFKKFEVVSGVSEESTKDGIVDAGPKKMVAIYDLSVSREHVKQGIVSGNFAIKGNSQNISIEDPRQEIIIVDGKTTVFPKYSFK